METNPYAAPNASLDVSASAAGPARVGFWPRLGAAMIDGIVVVIVGVLISGFVASLFPDYLAHMMEKAQAKLDPKVAEQMHSITKVTITIMRVGMAVSLFSLVYALGEGLAGRALGKLLLGLRIADVNARPASTGRLLGRVAIKQAQGLCTLLAMTTGVYVLETVGQVVGWVVGIGCLFVLAQHRRALHDLAVGTAVYHNTDVAVGDR
jgi:uncharacterized RDD family membrane protein YckC